MAKLIMVYASMSGNTEDMAKEIEETIEHSGESIDVFEAFETDASVIQHYDGILIGTYTWGDGELPDELLDFYDELAELDLSGKKAAVFGSFDWSYGDGGIAVDIMREALEKQGAEIVEKDLKVELDPEPQDRVECRSFAKSFLQHFSSMKSA